MATNPTPSTCLKCNTPMVPGAGFCGTCGTPAGSPGRPPMPPPMPPRALTMGSTQVIVPMDQGAAMQAAIASLPRVGGEVTNQSPVQVAFRMGNFFTGRFNGAMDSFPEGPNRTAVNVTVKPDFASLLPGALIAIAVALIAFILLQKAAVDGTAAAQAAATQAMMQNPYAPIQPQAGAGIGYFLQPWMVFLLVALFVALAGYMLNGPMLEKRKRNLMMALQSLGGMPPGLPGTPHQGFGPQVGPMGAGIPGQGAPQQATPFEQLRKLAELRDSGAISVDDFEKAKADIMKKLA
jgi:preprotein translocase subunit SecG